MTERGLKRNDVGGRVHPLVAPPDEELERWLPPVKVGSARHPLASPAAAAVWHGVVWGRLGRGDVAWAWWDSVNDPELQPWIAAERGRLLREVGLHAQAKLHDTAGLAAAVDLTDVVMLRLSLAADWVGLDQPALAASALAGASDLLDELQDGPRTARQRLRRTWVSVEVAIAAKTAPSVGGLPASTAHGVRFDADHQHGTDFHRAKGLLFAAVVREDPVLLDASARLAPPALRWAIELVRLDAGDQSAGTRAVAAWRAIVGPPGCEAAIRRGPTSQRIELLA
jgi:hypothetical protein